MIHLNTTFKIIASSISLVAGYFIYIITSRRKINYPQKEVDSLYDHSSLGRSLGKKAIAIITGSTGGIGLAMAEELYSYGLTVIIASRSEKKCQQVVDDIKRRFPNSTGALDFAQLEVGDLESVNKFTAWFKSKYSYLTFLINNAGQHYAQGDMSQLLGGVRSTLSPQGYDEVFSINYLGHFLLTENLLHMIKNGKVVNIASSYHSQADGSTLWPKGDKGDQRPDAANGVNRNILHRRRAYGVTKLAQILQTTELNRRLSASGNNKVVVVSVCPGWVATNIIPHNAFGNIIRKLAYSPKESLLTPMSVLFDDSLKGGQFVANQILPVVNWSTGPLILRVCGALFIRDTVVDILAFVLSIIQTGSYGYNIQPATSVARDPALGKALYDWSITELKSSGFLKAK